MKRIGILTAGGDTPALNATVFGAVTRASQLGVEMIGIIKGFGGLLDSRCPSVELNPLMMPIPEVDPCMGGSLLGASRTYIDCDDCEAIEAASRRLKRLKIQGLVCIGGDGTINGMQGLAARFPCVLAPKTIDNDLGLNYIDEANEWVHEPSPSGEPRYRHRPRGEDVALDEIINYATPGYATAVYVVAQSIQRIRTTAESHRRICIIEVMGRQSGYIALGSAYGQPDIILIPEVPLDFPRLEQRVRELYDLQKHAVIVVGEGLTDESGCVLGEVIDSVDPAGNIKFSGAAEGLSRMLERSLGDEYFVCRRRHDTAAAALFTRKIGHTQRGGRPIRFDRFYAAQLGGKAVEMLVAGDNNAMATLQWCEPHGFTLDSLPSNKLRDRWGIIHPRSVHHSMYNPQRFQPSKLGVQYLQPIFTNAIGTEDMEEMLNELFAPGNLTGRYQSINVDIQKRIRYLD
jgi:ATP-dependent phosphofructokinase / diphosphate-dependent phosphofructokinase